MIIDEACEMTLDDLCDGPGGPYPATSDVRAGVEYDAGLVGTLAVPPASSVALGVPVDNTTGTAVLTAANVASILTTWTTAPLSGKQPAGSPGALLQNIGTPASGSTAGTGLYEAIAAIDAGLTDDQAKQLSYLWDRFYRQVTRNYGAGTETVRHADGSVSNFTIETETTGGTTIVTVSPS